MEKAVSIPVPDTGDIAKQQLCIRHSHILAVMNFNIYVRKPKLSLSFPTRGSKKKVAKRINYNYMKWHNISNLLDGLGKFVFNGRSYKA